jgi:hypothetical protein
MQFEEIQYFRQWWLILITVFTLCFPIVALFQSHQQFELVHYLGGIGVPLVIFTLMFFVLRLETVVDEQGIHYRFFPFHITTRLKTWDEIEKAYVRVYKPIAEYGGWGYRFAFGDGIALNVSGNVGLQIVYKNGKKLLLGTKKRDVLEAFMKGLYEKGLAKDDVATADLRDRY